ncbi:phage tail tape measure protein [Arthrobacter sp. NicSoilC5]|uniref:phage tail tape measure protein n=1 Tax=Arthrobacter sp. NicSoilC5 TaxID=2831000 RepID=UPI001CC75D05|nr:phage tail tape measure protein [Arthrobacter sp. NicSoilC5]BCW79010.1 hypothetical protein NicSoilC5_10290 [Arthrobacter sp. NicSoilC5]
MATQQLLFDILATSKGVDKTFQEVADSAESMAGKLGAAGAKATEKLFSPMTAAAAGGIAGAALMTGLHTAIDMDSVTSKMAAGLALTAPESQKAGQVAGDLYSSAYGESFGDVADAVGAVMSSISGMRGASSEEIQAMTADVMNLSSAFEFDVGRTSQVAGQLIKTGLAKNGTEAVDLLAATLSKVPVNVREDVMDAIDEYGPMFANLGMSGGEAMTLLADASAKGMYGIDKTGDALKELTIRATDGSKSTEGAMEAIGLNAHDMANQMLAGGDTARAAFDKIIMGLADIKDPAQQSQAALALFGTPLEDLGTAEIPKFIDSLLNSQEALGTVEGAAGNLGNTLNSGPAAAFTQLQRTVETELGKMAAQFLPVLTPIIQGLLQFAPVIVPVVIALGAMAGAISLVNLAMMPHALLIGGIVLGVMALVAAITFLVMNWDGVVAFLRGAWEGFIGWFQGVMGGFLGWWDGVWSGLVGLVQDIVGNVLAWVGANWGLLLSFFIGPLGLAIQWIVDNWSGIVDFFAGVWAALVTGVMTGVHAFVDPIVNGVTQVWNFIATVFTNIGNFLASAWNWIASLVGNIIKAFVATHGEQIAEIWNNIVGVFTAIGDFFVGIWNWYIGIITGALQAVWGAVSAVFTAVWGFITAVFTAIGDFLVGVWNWYVGVISAAAQAVWGVIAAVFTAVWGFIAGVFTAIGGFIAGVWNTIVAVISGAVSAVWGTIVAGFSAAWGFISGVFGQVAGFLGGVWGGIVSGVSGMVGNVLGVLGGLGSQIMGVLSGAGSWLYNTGRSIVEGLISGVQSLAGNIGNAFLNMVPGWIVGPFKEALGIHSPSRVFAGFGENIGEGVLVGVGRTQASIDDRMATLVTVPDLGSTGAGSLGSGSGVLGGSRGGSIDDLIRAIREQRPIQVNGAPGMDEELLARATAEQIHWRG